MTNKHLRTYPLQRGGPLRVGIIGMGGFAGTHHGCMLRLEEQGLSRLVCTCDPESEKFAGRMEELRFKERGVRVFGDYIEMLDEMADEMDLVVIPTPISLHAIMHKAAVERGLPVYLEKPPSLDPIELEEMIRVDGQSPFATYIGFSLTVGTPRYEFKRRIIAGEFGKVREVRLQSMRGRVKSYFKRAPWAGRLTLNGRLVLDSVMGNAASHNVQTCTFIAGGPELHSRMQMESVEAELYRAHDIDGADTFFVRGTTTDGVDVRMALSHACSLETDSDAAANREVVITDKARLSFDGDVSWRVEWNDGRVESEPPVGSWPLDDNHRAYYDYLYGERECPATTLEDCRPFVQLHALSYVSSGEITTVTDVTEETTAKGECVAINGLDEAFRCFLESGKLPFEQKLPWARKTPARLVTTEQVGEVQHLMGL